MYSCIGVAYINEEKAIAIGENFETHFIPNDDLWDG